MDLQSSADSHTPIKTHRNSFDPNLERAGGGSNTIDNEGEFLCSLIQVKPPKCIQYSGAVELTIGKLQAVLILSIPSPKW